LPIDKPVDRLYYIYIKNEERKMELSTLRRLWQEKHPEGNVWILTSNGGLVDSGKQTGKFQITFSNNDSKPYVYKAISVYKLAERLSLIPVPEIDYWVESHNCINALNEGKSFSTICGIYDTIRSLDNGKSFSNGLKINESKDEYDRTVYTYSMEEK
jgi:hypothetical protein